MNNRYVLFAIQLIPAAVLIPVGYLKLVANEADVALFTTLEMEPHGRVVIGVVEIMAGLLLLTPQAGIGALLAVGVMLGAIIAHATVLGFDVTHMGMLALVLLSSAFILFARRRELPVVGRSFGPSAKEQG